MKRRLLIFVAILLAISTLAHAETFQLHSGVQFGMSMNEATNLEEGAGYTVYENSSLYCYEFDDVDYMRVSAPNLAGLGGTIEYLFDASNHQLNMCFYSLRYTSINDITQLTEAYTKKYGPVVSDGNAFIDIPGTAHDAYDLYLEYANTILTKELKVNAFYQWLYPLENGGTVDIQLIAMHRSFEKVWGQSQRPDVDYLYVTYSYRSPEEMKLVYSEMQEKEEARNADI